MPNYCANELVIKGSASDINEVVSQILTEGNLDFEKIIPSPATPEECDKRYLLQSQMGIMPTENKLWFNWYLWNRENWGTKWNAWDTQVSDIIHTEDGKAKIIINFFTAWVPAIPVMEELINNHPELNIIAVYDEPGMGFYGYVDNIGDHYDILPSGYSKNEDGYVLDF